MIFMIVAFLGMLDVFAAALLLWPGLWPGVLFVLGIIYALKGLSSLAGSLAGGFLFDWMGATDLLAGLCFILGFAIPYLWMVLLLKGIMSLLTG